MKTTEAIKIVEEELIESLVRCHYPYVMTCGPTAIGQPPNVTEGIYIIIDSEVFGRIAGASKATFSAAIRAVALELLETRKARWREEATEMDG